MAGGELRQLAVEAGRKVVANFAQLLFDDVEIIYQPFRRGRDGLLALHGARRGAVIFQQDAAVFEHARNQRAPFLGIGDDRCAAARLSACCSRRSTLKSSARIVSSGSVKMGGGGWANLAIF